MHAVSIGNEWEKNILEGSSGQNKTCLQEGIAELLWVREQCQLSLGGGKAPPHPAAGISGHTGGRWAVPELPGQQAAPPSRCPGGVTRTMGRSGYPVASPQHMPGCAWSRNPGPLPRRLSFMNEPPITRDGSKTWRWKQNQCWFPVPLGGWWEKMDVRTENQNWAYNWAFSGELGKGARAFGKQTCLLILLHGEGFLMLGTNRPQ